MTNDEIKESVQRLKVEFQDALRELHDAVEALESGLADLESVENEDDARAFEEKYMNRLEGYKHLELY